MREEYAIVLDFLPNGYPFDSAPSHRKVPIVQALGITKFIVLELVAKKDIYLKAHDKIYIGDAKRDRIHHINGKIASSKLTGTAASELPFVIENIVEENEARFVEFFNKAQPLSMRMHQLELLPGLGKKHMWEIVDERKVEPFKDFADIKKRVSLLPDPKSIIVKRIIKELDGLEKHKIFIRD
jgi:putative nucleotide binding protein